jgi:hypothetical protein
MTPPAARCAVEHFGERILPGKYGHCLTREMYLVAAVSVRHGVGFGPSVVPCRRMI